MKRVALGTIEGYETAMRIYTEGAFSEPMAYLNLTTPLQEALEIGDEVIGTSEDSGEEVTGLIVNNYPRGTRRIRVMYQTNEVQSSYVDCQVAANPDPNLEGCKFRLNHHVMTMRNSRLLTHAERFRKRWAFGRNWFFSITVLHIQPVEGQRQQSVSRTT